uniref:Uncharacterized protein n=1 Tax=Aedes albopictus TaxID=7160 RepID=A0A1W7R5E6_AEDAL
MAHRNQLRVNKDQNHFEKPTIRWGRQRSQPTRQSSGDEFHGFSEDELQRGQKRKYAVEAEERSPGTMPRRSKRIRRIKCDKDFVYLSSK